MSLAEDFLVDIIFTFSMFELVLLMEKDANRLKASLSRDFGSGI